MADQITKRLQNTTETFDPNSGEMVTVTKSYGVKVAKAENFMMMFLENIAPLFNIRNKKDINVMLKMVAEAEYNTGRIALTTALRQRMLEELDHMHETAFSRCLKNLVTAGILSGSRGEFFVNPKIFWKGTTDEREAYLKAGGAMRFTVEYSLNGRTSIDVEVPAILKQNQHFDTGAPLSDDDY